MGIKGLSNFLRNKHSSLFTKPCDLCQYAGNRFAVDVSIYLYQFAYGRNPSDNSGFLQKFVEQYRLFESYGIRAVYIFDGNGARDDKQRERIKRAMRAKRSDIRRNEKIDALTAQLDGVSDSNSILHAHVLRKVEPVDQMADAGDMGDLVKRNSELSCEIVRLQLSVMNVLPIHYSNLRQIFLELHIPFYEAVGEAEKACAWLSQHGYVDVVLSNDYDALVCGANRVLMNHGSVTSPLVELRLDAILTSLNLTYLEFVDFCVLCGTDFNCSLPQIGPVTALSKIRRYHCIEELLRMDAKLVALPEVVAACAFTTARARFLDNSCQLTNVFAVSHNQTQPFLWRDFGEDCESLVMGCNVPFCDKYQVAGLLNPH